MGNQPFILALDIGTSSTRAVLYDAGGNAVDGVHSQLTYQLTTSHEGEASVDADFLLGLVARTIDETLQAAGTRAEQIAGVATSAFWHTLLPLDRAGRPLLPLLTWEDTRPQRAALELRALLDEASTHRRTGTRLHTSYWPAKIRWLTTAYPEIAAYTAHYVSFGEYLHERLLGRAVCSLSMASGTGLLNIRARAWDSELLTLLDISPAQLPAPGDLPESLEGLAPEFAARWPALAHVPWFPAIGDGAAANFGSNCTSPTTWAVTMGTSSAIRVVVPPGQVEPEQGLWLYAVDKKRALLGGALSEGGNMLAWLKQTLRLSDLAEFDQQFASLQPAAHGLTVLPQLAGERSPGWHPHAAMTIAGLTVLASQVMQPRLIVNGGALLKSALLRQILADTLNRPLELSANSEASARGAALLALETLHLLPNLTQLQPATTTIVTPDPKRHQIYCEAKARQQELYQKMFD